MKTLPKAKASPAPKAARRTAKQTAAPQEETVSVTSSESEADSFNVTQSQVSEDEIAQRAYNIWMANGCPEGCEEEHWHQAQRELSQSPA